MTKLIQRLVITTLVTLLGTGAACSDDDNGNGLCGNGFLDQGEVCDTINLGGQACEDLGNYTGGNLACATDCSAYDTAGCTVPLNCGDGQLRRCTGIGDGSPPLEVFLVSWPIALGNIFFGTRRENLTTLDGVIRIAVIHEFCVIGIDIPFTHCFLGPVN